MESKEFTAHSSKIDEKCKMTKSEKKALRKQKRCIKIMENHDGIKSVMNPTQYLLVGNGGLVCSVSREALVDVFEQYGHLDDIIMIPDRPYAFVVYKDIDSSIRAMESVHGLELKNSCLKNRLYLSYLDSVPEFSSHNIPSCKIPGLIILENFISEKEEQEMLSCFEWNVIPEGKQKLKHRIVKHFGFEFNYTTCNVDQKNPLPDSIPDVCKKYLTRLLSLNHISYLPDQLTVNIYFPGHGIPPHTDTHSAFESEIICFSLNSQIVMNFIHPRGHTVPVLLPRRSVLIMMRECRYLWSHGITPRKTDLVPVIENGKHRLTLSLRQTRISFTFRTVRRKPCTCEYKEQCDSQNADIERHQWEQFISTESAKQLEELHVHQVYDNIAEHFSSTRFKPWPRVVAFLDSLHSGSIVADIGCGNGKYLGSNPCLFQIGCDYSQNLIKICQRKGLEVFIGNSLYLPLRSCVVDACICIAVLHHFATRERRFQALKEIVRILAPGGVALIYVWAMEQDKISGPSNYLKHSRMAAKQKNLGIAKGIDELSILEHQNFLQRNDSVSEPHNIYCFHHSKDSDSESRKRSVMKNSHFTSVLPIHCNRTNFEKQDLLVPWHTRSNEKSHRQEDSICKENEASNFCSVYHRFYHVFSHGELETLASELNGVTIKESYYDMGNWCVLLEKVS